MTELKWYRRAKWIRDDPERIQGMYIEHNDIESVRAAANWIRQQPGWGVPYLTAEGLLIRHPIDPEHLYSENQRFHVWFASGNDIQWNGHEFDEFGTYEAEDEDG